MTLRTLFVLGLLMLRPAIAAPPVAYVGPQGGMLPPSAGRPPLPGAGGMPMPGTQVIVPVVPPTPSPSAAEIVYWCDNPHGYYPNVTNCHGPWRATTAAGP